MSKVNHILVALMLFNLALALLTLDWGEASAWAAALLLFAAARTDEDRR